MDNQEAGGTDLERRSLTMPSLAPIMCGSPGAARLQSRRRRQANYYERQLQGGSLNAPEGMREAHFSPGVKFTAHLVATVADARMPPRLHYSILFLASESINSRFFHLSFELF